MEETEKCRVQGRISSYPERTDSFDFYSDKLFIRLLGRVLLSDKIVGDQ